MRYSIVLGTRPEIIKMMPVMRELKRRNIDYFVIHTGQHYDFDMDRVFFDEFLLNPEMINLEIGSGTHAETTAKALVGIEKELMKRRPDIVLVQGDTNTVLAGALAAVKLHVVLAHVEAGLRSHFRAMPEEHNRVVADHVADLLFAPTKKARDMLYAEGIKQGVYVTGNTVVDSLYQSRSFAEKKSTILNDMGLVQNGYFLVTLHREENVDDKARLLGVIEGLDEISKRYGLPILYPVHPRTLARLKEFDFEERLRDVLDIKIVKPVGFFDFLLLEANARLILTDSGGVQEEACVLNVPCVTLRDNTERHETVDVGANVLAGCDPVAISTCVADMMKKRREWKNPFGNGTAAKKIVDVCERFLKV